VQPAAERLPAPGTARRFVHHRVYHRGGVLTRGCRLQGDLGDADFARALGADRNRARPPAALTAAAAFPTVNRFLHGDSVWPTPNGPSRRSSARAGGHVVACEVIRVLFGMPEHKVPAWHRPLNGLCCMAY
jgi:hypothetical protein